MRWLIVDDEPLARTRMARLLREAGETVVGEAGYLGAAIDQSVALGDALDAVSLDIEMPRVVGAPTAGTHSDTLPLDVFDWAQALKATRPELAIVLVSAHAEFGPAAFEAAVDDYLLKPVEAARVATMLERLRRRVLQRGDQASGSPPMLAIRAGRTTRRVPLTAIGALEASGGMTIVHWGEAEGGRCVFREGVIEASLSELETQLGATFLRVHRGWLVRVDAVRALDTHGHEGGHEAALDVEGVAPRVPVSRRQMAAMREILLTQSWSR